VTAKPRSNSKLPELVELFLSRPLVTLPRELTGRTRYRAWGIV
jgi:hypothetical protein